MKGSVIFVFLRLEAVIDKNALSLDYLDFNGAIRKRVLGQLEVMFDPGLYDIYESLSSYTFSLKKDFPALPIMELRRRVYSLLSLSPNISKEQELAKKMSNATIARAVDIAMSNPKYDYFLWRKRHQQLQLNNVSGGLRGVLDIEARGLQLYISHSPFDAEISGELLICTAALRKALGDITYSDCLSFGIHNYVSYLF